MTGHAPHILIADDDPIIQRILKDYLEDLGYKTTSAMDGDAAIAELQKDHFDLLISDIIMPGKDGIELTKTIRNMDIHHNLPIILLSARGSASSKVTAFDAFADDYITKPFDFDEVTARIKIQLHLKHLREELAEKNRSLLIRNSELEAHLDIARQIQQQLLPLNIKELYGIRISSFYKPVDKVGGDIFDFIPLGNGKVGVFIGDVSGHGVPSAFLNIVLRMMLHSIAREEQVLPGRVLEKINSTIMPYLREEDFITASYGIIDVNHKLLYSASAGHPRAIIFRAGNKKIKFIDGGGPGIGIVEGATYETHPVRLFAGDRIIYYTDGLIELKSPDNEMPGTKGLCRIIEASMENPSFETIMPEIIRGIERFSGGRAYEDDMTVLCLEVEDSFYYSWFTKFFNIQSAVETLIKPLTSESRIDAKDIKKVKTALFEALSNALEHGNLQIPSSLKECEDVVEGLFERLKEERMAQSAYAGRKITAGYIIDEQRITYHIKDEGPGFDHRNVKDPTSPENITRCCGRGISLMKMCMDEISFNEKGNSIRLIKYFSSSSKDKV